MRYIIYEIQFICKFNGESFKLLVFVLSRTKLHLIFPLQWILCVLVLYVFDVAADCVAVVRYAYMLIRRIVHLKRKLCCFFDGSADLRSIEPQCNTEELQWAIMWVVWKGGGVCKTRPTQYRLHSRLVHFKYCPMNINFPRHTVRSLIFFSHLLYFFVQ